MTITYHGFHCSTQGRASPSAASANSSANAFGKWQLSCWPKISIRRCCRDVMTWNSTVFFLGEGLGKDGVKICTEIMKPKKVMNERRQPSKLTKKKLVLRKVSIPWHLLITLCLSPWHGLDNRGRSTIIVIPTLHKGKNLKPTGNLWLPCCQSDLEQKWFFPAHFQPQSRQTQQQRYNGTTVQRYKVPCPKHACTIYSLHRGVSIIAGRFWVNEVGMCICELFPWPSMSFVASDL